MKITPKLIQQFLTNPNKNNILLFGPEIGLLNHRLKAICKSLGLGEIHKFSYNKINSDLSEIYEKFGNLSFFSNQSIIIIENCSNVLNKDFKKLIEENTQNYLICLAGDLPASSSWRKFFDSHQNAASIACYEIDEKQLRSYIINFLNKKNLIIQEDALNLFISYVSMNFQYCQNALQKIESYMHTKNDHQIDRNIIYELFNNPLEEEIDSLCHLIIKDQEAKFSIKCQQLIKSGHSIVTIVRFMLYYLQRLLIVSEEIQSGNSESNAIKILRPPLFFKQHTNFTYNLRNSNPSLIIRKISWLNEIEKIAKQNLQIAELMILQNELI